MPRLLDVALIGALAVLGLGCGSDASLGGAASTSGTAATKEVTAAEFRAQTQQAGTAEALQVLVREGAARNLHKAAWELIWKDLASASEAQRPGLRAEATRLADAVETALGDRSFAARLQEDARAQAAGAAPVDALRRGIADARKALLTFKKPEIARAALADLRKQAEAGHHEAELAEIAQLEAQLPPAPTK